MSEDEKKYKKNYLVHLNIIDVEKFKSRLQKLSDKNGDKVSFSSRINELIKQDNKKKPEEK